METSPAPKIITTQRLTLRPFHANDRERLLAITQEPDIFQYFPITAAWQMEKVERYINHQTGQWQRFGYGHWAVTMTETGQLMGWCGLEFLPETSETEVAYLIGGEFWGRGYMTEAARASVNFGLTEIGLQEIIGLTDPRNIASQRVLEKSGLTFRRRQVYFGMEMFKFSTQPSGRKEA